MWERRGLELRINGELETYRLRLLACSKESRGQAASWELMTCGGAMRESRSFLFFTSKEGVAVSKTYPERYPRRIKHYFLLFKLTNHRILTGYVSGSIGAVSGWMRALSKVSVQRSI